MKYKLIFSASVEKSIKKWKKSNQELYKKLAKILDELIVHPKTGIGHPKPLVNGGGITYSRRIAAHHRIVYNIYDDRIEIHIVSVEGHYDDK